MEPVIARERKIGEVIGFVGMLVIASVLLWFVLQLLNRIPDSWTAVHTLGIVLGITVVGYAIRRVVSRA